MTPPFIRAATSLGLVERWMTPFWRVTASPVKKRRLTEWFSPFINSGLPVTAQLMGDDPGMISRVAGVLLDIGAKGINLNFGCPSGQVLRHGCGGGLLRRPDELLRLLAAVRKDIPGVPLSIKIRGGFDEFDIGWLKTISALEVDKIFFHYRLVSEGYQDYSFDFAVMRFAEMRKTVSGIPLIANGDIDTVSKMTTLLNLGFDGVMTGRGWLKNPSILKEMTDNVSTGKEINFWRKRLFFATLTAAAADDFVGFSRGNAIELSLLIWGPGNPVFLELLKSDGKMTDVTTDLKLKFCENDESIFLM